MFLAILNRDIIFRFTSPQNKTIYILHKVLVNFCSKQNKTEIPITTGILLARSKIHTIVLPKSPLNLVFARNVNVIVHVNKILSQDRDFWAKMIQNVMSFCFDFALLGNKNYQSDNLFFKMFPYNHMFPPQTLNYSAILPTNLSVLYSNYTWKQNPIVQNNKTNRPSVRDFCKKLCQKKFIMRS